MTALSTVHPIVAALSLISVSMAFRIVQQCEEEVLSRLVRVVCVTNLGTRCHHPASRRGQG
jgi:hypothetical protein